MAWRRMSQAMQKQEQGQSQPVADLEQTRRVGQMFGRIARRYDLMNRLMTAGLDRRWRRLAVRAVRAGGAAQLLDIGTGTGDLALALATESGVSRVTGLDIASPMLMQALQKRPANATSPSFVLATATSLPFSDAVFDAAISAFTLRNIPDLATALREIRRVLRPSGRFVCLEITRPGPGLRTWLFELYFERLVPRIGKWISGDSDAYAYLPASVGRFLSAEELARAMIEAGFRSATHRYVGPGGVALHIGEL